MSVMMPCLLWLHGPNALPLNQYLHWLHGLTLDDFLSWNGLGNGHCLFGVRVRPWYCIRFKPTVCCLLNSESDKSVMGGRVDIRTDKTVTTTPSSRKHMHTKAEIEHYMTQRSDQIRIRLKLNALAQVHANRITLGYQLESSPTCHQTGICYCCAVVVVVVAAAIVVVFVLVVVSCCCPAKYQKIVWRQHSNEINLPPPNTDSWPASREKNKRLRCLNTPATSSVLRCSLLRLITHVFDHGKALSCLEHVTMTWASW